MYILIIFSYFWLNATTYSQCTKFMKSKQHRLAFVNLGNVYASCTSFILYVVCDLKVRSLDCMYALY